MRERELIPAGANRLDVEDFDLAVFDVDGTLYDAGRMRWRMLRALAWHCCLHPAAVADLRILREFRRCREQLAHEEVAQIGRLQYELPSQKLGVSPDRVEKLVRSWMYERPLEYLPSCRFDGIDTVFELLRSAQRGIAILSDYPAREKLEALDLVADTVVTALDKEVDCLKPQVKGLERVLELTGVSASRCLFIGDREDTDGACACRAGVSFLRKVPGIAQAAHEFPDYRYLAREMHAVP